MKIAVLLQNYIFIYLAFSRLRKDYWIATKLSQFDIYIDWALFKLFKNCDSILIFEHWEISNDVKDLRLFNT